MVEWNHEETEPIREGEGAEEAIGRDRVTDTGSVTRWALGGSG